MADWNIRRVRHGHARKHVKTVEYSSWRSMRARCLKPNHKSFARYGGRGITICSEWSDFAVFLKDMGLRPSPKHTLDRIENNGNYEPGNCRWATMKQQCDNRSSSKIIEFNGEKKSISDWSRSLDVEKSLIGMRLLKGWSVEKALTMPASFYLANRKEHYRNRPTTRRVEFQGKLYAIGDLAERFSLPYSCIKSRINSGWTIEQALNLEDRPFSPFARPSRYARKRH